MESHQTMLLEEWNLEGSRDEGCVRGICGNTTERNEEGGEFSGMISVYKVRDLTRSLGLGLGAVLYVYGHLPRDKYSYSFSGGRCSCQGAGKEAETQH